VDRLDAAREWWEVGVEGETWRLVTYAGSLFGGASCTHLSKQFYPDYTNRDTSLCAIGRARRDRPRTGDPLFFFFFFGIGIYDM
jgi:hypothetical protein